jgi:putative transposase
MGRPPRLARFEYVGRYSYFLTICTHERSAIFRNEEWARLVIAQFRRTATTFSFAILAYCVMPDHVHLLLAGRSEGADLRRFVKRVKQSVGQRYANRTKQRLWQEGYFDHVLRPGESEASMAKYIIENPVRAGLVAVATDYPYSGSDVWTVQEIAAAVL